MSTALSKVPREVVDAVFAAGTRRDGRETVERLVLAVATGAADGTAEQCATAVEFGIHGIETVASGVPAGQVAALPLSAVCEMLRNIAATLRLLKSDGGETLEITSESSLPPLRPRICAATPISSPGTTTRNAPGPPQPRRLP